MKLNEPAPGMVSQLGGLVRGGDFVPWCGQDIVIDLGPRQAAITGALSGVPTHPCVSEMELRSLFEGEELRIMLFDYSELGLVAKEAPSH